MVPTWCDGCGDVVGRDCFNPVECLWIKQDIARRATELEGDVADEYAAWCEEQHREYLATSEYMAMQAEIEMVAGVSSTEVR